MAKDDTLKGLNVAILVTDGFEQVELTEPRKALDEAGATTKIVSPKHQRARAWNFTDWSIELPVDVELDQAKPEDFDALLLPGDRSLTSRPIGSIATCCTGAGPHPLEDTFAAFEALRDEGKILFYGVSNFDVPDLEEAWEIAGEGAIVCNQVLYHLQERAIEHGVLP